MRQRFIPVRDFRQDLPGIFSISAMVILCASLYQMACDSGNRMLCRPSNSVDSDGDEMPCNMVAIGTAENNNGCYPVAESVMGAIMAGVVVLNMTVNRIAAAVANCRKAEDRAPLVAGPVIERAEGFYYYGLTNIACLHLPRLVLATSVLGLMAVLPWVNIAMDWGVRMQHDDPDVGERLAGEYGHNLLIAIPFVQFFTSCLLPVITNLNYVRPETGVSAPKAGLFARILGLTDHMFVDHSRVVSKVPTLQY